LERKAMTTDINKELVLGMYEALAKGDAAGYFARMADDVRVTYFGSHRFARTFEGKADIMQNFVPALRERLDGSIKLHVTNAVAEGDQVVVEARGEARARDGRPYSNQYCIVLKIANGKVSEIREYMDTELTKSIFG
jgi:hypothetical protein